MEDYQAQIAALQEQLALLNDPTKSWQEKFAKDIHSSSALAAISGGISIPFSIGGFGRKKKRKRRQKLINQRRDELGRLIRGLEVKQHFLAPETTRAGISAQAQLPGIIARIQQQLGAQPTLNVPIGNGGLLKNLSSKGADMIAKGQTLNPTILKARK